MNFKADTIKNDDNREHRPTNLNKSVYIIFGYQLFISTITKFYQVQMKLCCLKSNKKEIFVT